MLSDEDDSLGLFTAGSKPLQAYNYEPLESNVGTINTAVRLPVPRHLIAMVTLCFP